MVYDSNVECRLSYHAADVEYSYGDKWRSLENVENITVDSGERVYFRYVGDEYLSGEVLTSTTKTFDVGGDIRTVIYGNKKVKSVSDYELKGLFSGTNVVNTNQLLMMFNSVGVSGYESMFKNCTSLISAPELPATTLADSCYNSMFSGCTSLTTAPELPATTLAEGCYSNMFSGCSNLNYINCLATDMSAANCTKYWVLGVASTGTFVKAAGTSWSTGTGGIPEGWTVEEV